MRILLIALQCQSAGHGDGKADPAAQARRIRTEEDQTIALARAMRDGGNIAPMLVCRKGMRLHRLAQEFSLPCMTVGSPGSLWGLLRLWRWQRRFRYLLIQTVGEEAMPLGRRLLRLRPAGSALLGHAFFLRPPDAAICRSKDMLAAQRILYGSDHVRQRLLEAWQDLPQGQSAPPCDVLEHLAPGINSESMYLDSPGTGQPQPPDAYPACSGDSVAEVSGRQHFIFGMADSLVPRSGAQTVVRAMAALWQRADLPPWEVRMLGSGPRFAEVLDEARNLGVASRLCLLADQEPAEALRHCNAWLAPGNAPDEAPETLWQGCAAGLPLICSANPLHEERLAPHASPDWPKGPAVLVPMNDAQALARAMIDILQNKELRMGLARRSQALGRQVGWQHMATQGCTMFEGWLRGLETAASARQPAALSPQRTDDHEV